MGSSGIAYDARMSLGQYRGMGRFLRFLIAGRETQLLGLCASGESDESLHLVADGSSFYPVWEQWDLPRLIKAHNVDTFLAPYNTAPLRLPSSVRLVLVVHDLIYMERLPLSRSVYQNIGRWYRRLVVPRAIRRADVVVTVSIYTAQQISSRFGLDSGKIHVIPNTLGGEWFLGERKHRESEHYVLVVAGEAPSKNLPRAIAAFGECCRRLGDTTLRLKVAGVKGKYHSVFQVEANRNGIAGQVDFLCYVSDQEMRQLYSQAELFLMPSLAEGFGIPILEAMASGVPVASSASTCLPEIGGHAARYFNPLSIEDMAGTMYDILASQTVQLQMSQMGWIQAQSFHPDMVKGTIRSFWENLERC